MEENQRIISISLLLIYFVLFIFLKKYKIMKFLPNILLLGLGVYLQIRYYDTNIFNFDFYYIIFGYLFILISVVSTLIMVIRHLYSFFKSKDKFVP